MTNNTVSLKAAIGLLVGTVGLVIAALLVLASFPALTHADTLYRQLEIGMTGADVSALQTFLAKDITLYPQGLVTGYFGFLTKSAVSNFQSRNGIDAVGRVGPITLPILNARMAGGMGVDRNAAIISNVGINASKNNATVSWNTNESAKGIVYYSTSPLVTYELLNSVNVSGTATTTDTNLRTSQSVSLQGLFSNTTYYYMVYATDAAGNVSVTWPSTFKTSN